MGYDPPAFSEEWRVTIASAQNANEPRWSRLIPYIVVGGIVSVPGKGRDTPQHAMRQIRT